MYCNYLQLSAIQENVLINLRKRSISSGKYEAGSFDYNLIDSSEDHYYQISDYEDKSIQYVFFNMVYI